MTLRRTPAAVMVGTECIEPGAGAIAPAAAVLGPATAPPVVEDSDGRRVLRLVESLDLSGASGQAVKLRSWMAARVTIWRARVEVSLDGLTWTPAPLVATEDGLGFAIDVSQYAGAIVLVRFVFDLGPPG